MRINQFVARASGLSRRAADAAIEKGRVQLNGRQAVLGDVATEGDQVTLDGRAISPAVKTTTVLFHKPAGYVTSRDGQGSRTIYDLLPPELHHLKPVGRLDKDSSGLLLLTDDGELANQLTHPRYGKEKVYEVTIDKPLAKNDIHKLRSGVPVEDYVSQLRLKMLDEKGLQWQISLSQGKNRQIRRTFGALSYKVTGLHRTAFGEYSLSDLPSGKWRLIDV